MSSRTTVGIVALLLLAGALAHTSAAAAAAGAAAAGAAGAGAQPERRVSVSKSCSWEGFEAAVERFSRIIQFGTVSDSSAPNHASNTTAFRELKAWLAGAYPAVWAALEVEDVGTDGLSTLLTWRGSEPALRPVLVVSHIDVVPVADYRNWTHPPFSGAVADGFVWGRGTMDVKVTVVAALEAVSSLLEAGWSPRRTLMFAFGHDEEVGGGLGAAATAKLLEERGVELEVIWDEGSSIMSDGVKPLTSRPVALVATGEKGFLTVKAHITSRGGHSSMPPIDGSAMGDVMARLLTRLAASPPSPKLVSPVTDMLRGIAPYAPAGLSALLSAIGRVPGVDAIVAGVMASASAEAAALTRTTVAATRISAGVADNVLPQRGTLGVNLRLLPGDTVEGALAYLRGVTLARDRAAVTWEADEATAQAASSVTPTDSPWYNLLKKAIQEVWEADGEPVVVLPFLLPGMTDSRIYCRLSAHGALRFLPSVAHLSDVARIHGTDERMAVDNYRGALCTARAFLALAGGRSQAAGADSSLPGAGGTDLSSLQDEL